MTHPVVHPKLLQLSQLRGVVGLTDVDGGGVAHMFLLHASGHFHHRQVLHQAAPAYAYADASSDAYVQQRVVHAAVGHGVVLHGDPDCDSDCNTDSCRVDPKYVAEDFLVHVYRSRVYKEEIAWCTAAISQTREKRALCTCISRPW